MASEETTALREILSQSSLFFGLDDESLDDLSNFCSLRKFEQGSAIVTEGELGDEFYTIGSGVVRVEKQTLPGREEVLASLGPWECFGELHIHRSATVIAVEPVICAVISPEHSSLPLWTTSGSHAQESSAIWPLSSPSA